MPNSNNLQFGKYLSLIGFALPGEMPTLATGYLAHIQDQGVLEQAKSNILAIFDSENLKNVEETFLRYWENDTQLLEQGREWVKNRLGQVPLYAPWICRTKIVDETRFEKEHPKLVDRFGQSLESQVYEIGPK